MPLRPAHILPALRGLFGPEVFVAAQLIGAQSAPLSAAESASISRAIPSRRAEFQAGRHAAKTALIKAGAVHPGLPMDTDRAPIWPTGFTGSITHSNGLALAGAAMLTPLPGGIQGKIARKITSIGLDMEPATPLEQSLWDEVLTLSEQEWLETQPSNKQGILAKVMFSIKECAYKAQYPMSKTLLDFNAFTTGFSLKTGTFTATFQINTAPFKLGQVIHGKLMLIDGMILTATVL